MCYDYSGWMQKKADDTKEWALKTLTHIFDEAGKDGLTSDELDDVKDCWTILAMLEGMKHEAPAEETTPDAVVARVTGQNVK